MIPTVVVIQAGETLDEQAMERLGREYRDRLRDYFAAAALTGALANPGVGDSYTILAADAYSVADAMLAARGGK